MRAKPINNSEGERGRRRWYSRVKKRPALSWTFAVVKRDLPGVESWEKREDHRQETKNYKTERIVEGFCVKAMKKVWVGDLVQDGSSSRMYRWRRV